MSKIKYMRNYNNYNIYVFIKFGTAIIYLQIEQLLEGPSQFRISLHFFVAH